MVTHYKYYDGKSIFCMYDQNFTSVKKIECNKIKIYNPLVIYYNIDIDRWFIDKLLRILFPTTYKFD